MKNYLSLPDDIFETILEFDGRYDKSRLLPSLQIIDFRLTVDNVVEKDATLRSINENFKHKQERCFEQARYFRTPSYRSECQKMANKYTKQCDELTGCIRDKTPTKKTLSAYDKRFSNVLSCFTLSKFREKRKKEENGVLWKSQKIYGVSVGAQGFCDVAIHMNDYVCVRYVNGGASYMVKGEKNGIEILDPKFIQKAKKTHRGQLLIKQLIKHLESTFKIGMSWDKRSLMHVDHINPCSNFDLTKSEEQDKCFHYTNLQMLWAKENLSKSDKVLFKCHK